MEVDRPGTRLKGRSVRAAPPATSFSSRTRTSSPRRASISAATSPLWPAPTTTTSARWRIAPFYRSAQLYAMADNHIKVIKNERGIGTGETRSGVEPRPNADGSLPPSGNALNPAIVEDPAGKTPGSAESGAPDESQGSDPGKTPGKAEG